MCSQFRLRCLSSGRTYRIICKGVLIKIEVSGAASIADQPRINRIPTQRIVKIWLGYTYHSI